MALKGDFHTHTLFSHGKGTVEDNVRAAHARGLEAIALTDHGFRHSMYNVRRSDFPFARREVERMRKIFPDMKILLGLETNIQGLDGRIDLRESDIDNLDVIICGYHKLVVAPNLKCALQFWLPTLVGAVTGKCSAKRRVKNTDAFLNAIHRYPIDVISHPGNDIGIYPTVLAEECARLGVLFELNGKRINLTDEELVDVAATGVEFVIDSDAHSPERVGDVSLPMSRVERIGIPYGQIANWDRLPELRSAKYKAARNAAERN